MDDAESDRPWAWQLDVMAFVCLAAVVIVVAISLAMALSLPNVGAVTASLFDIRRVAYATQSANTMTAVLLLIAAGAMASQRHRGVPTINVLDVLLPAASLVVVVLGVGGIVNTTTRQFGNESWVFRLQPLQAYLPAIALAALAVWLAPPPRWRRVSGAGSPPDGGTAGPVPLG